MTKETILFLSPPPVLEPPLSWDERVAKIPRLKADLATLGMIDGLLYSIHRESERDFGCNEERYWAQAALLCYRWQIIDLFARPRAFNLGIDFADAQAEVEREHPLPS